MYKIYAHNRVRVNIHFFTLASRHTHGLETFLGSNLIKIELTKKKTYIQPLDCVLINSYLTFKMEFAQLFIFSFAWRRSKNKMFIRDKNDDTFCLLWALFTRSRLDIRSCDERRNDHCWQSQRKRCRSPGDSTYLHIMELTQHQFDRKFPFQRFRFFFLCFSSVLRQLVVIIIIITTLCLNVIRKKKIICKQTDGGWI